MSPSASLHDATVVLDDRAVLRDVTIELGPGLAVLRGLNGAGKTTLLRAIAGLVPLSRGTRAVTSAPLYLGHRSMLLQDEHGQVEEAQSISAGLDYPGVGPEHSYLHSIGRATYPWVSDGGVLETITAARFS